MNFTEPISQIGAYASFLHLTEEDFIRFQSYQAKDYHNVNSLPLSIQAIFEIGNIIDQISNAGCYDDCIIDFLIAPSLNATIAIKQHFQVQYSRSEAIPIILKHRFQKIQWNQLTSSSELLTSLVEAIIEQLSSLDLLDWTDLSDRAEMSEHELVALYPAFNSFGIAALNVYGDNVGFDGNIDAQYFRQTELFLNEILNYK